MNNRTSLMSLIAAVALATAPSGAWALAGAAASAPSGGWASDGAAASAPFGVWGSVGIAGSTPSGGRTADGTARPEASAVPSPTTSAAKTAHLKGRATMYFPAPDNDIEITADAHAAFDPSGAWRPTRSWGTFRISHRYKMPDGTWFTNWGDFAVDCLTTGGPTATVTGRLTKVTPGGPWEELLKDRTRMGLSFYVAGKGRGPSRIGLSGAPLPGEGQLSACMAPAADAPVIKGGYTLLDKR
ncbi:hypothetical protein GCM10009733_051410 [Nonomuraea maheshkhaliensis]|uniref:Uncharacterized protein n=2 Tax=Nonomuraea maheshkhaliensis TaxID=419590 RepID=A0ABP4RG60_9ACTN